MAYRAGLRVATLGAGEPVTSSAEEDGPIQEAVQWIHEHYFHFMELGARIRTLQSRAAAVLADAQRQLDPDRQDAAGEVSSGLEALMRHWADFAGRMRWIVERIPGLGLGSWIIPVAVSAVALFVAGGAAIIMRHADQAERALDLLEQGVLSPEEAHLLGLDLSGPSLFGFSAGAGTALVAGGVLWWMLRRRSA